MKINTFKNNKIKTLIKSNFSLKNFFLSNYFSKKPLKMNNSDLFPIFKKIKLEILDQSNLRLFNLKKSKEFIKHVKKNFFFIKTSKQNKLKMRHTFLKRFLRQFDPVNNNKILTGPIQHFNLFYKKIRKEMDQTYDHEFLKEFYLSFSRLLTTDKINYLKKNFLSVFSILFLNKQIHRFIYFNLCSKRFQIQSFVYFFNAFFNFSFINIFLFHLLYNVCKKQHLNNSNAWIFNKYWLFIQPFPYFFYNDFNRIHPRLNSKNHLFKNSISSKSLEKNYFFSINQKLIFFKNTKNSFCSSFVYFSKIRIDFNAIVKKSKHSNMFQTKDHILKTYYLEQYKTHYMFKLNMKNKSSNSFIPIYFKTLRFKHFKCFIQH